MIFRYHDLDHSDGDRDRFDRDYNDHDNPDYSSLRKIRNWRKFDQRALRI